MAARIIIAFCVFTNLCCVILADNEYMVSKAEPITLDTNFETKLICEMNIEPDKFQWKFYPTDDYYNVTADIDLNSSKYKIIADKRTESKTERHKQRKKSAHTIVAKNGQVAGDYQCLAYYGASVVASVPWRVTLSKLGPFPYQKNDTFTVSEGNTVAWRCLPPASNPEAYIDYFRQDKRVVQPFMEPQLKSILLQNVSYMNSGVYRCTATLNRLHHTSNSVFTLRVAQNLPEIAPYFIMKPPSTHIVDKGKTVFLECAAVGNPVPSVVWEKKKNGGVLPKHRTEMVNGGLIIRNVSQSDDGVYECVHHNVKGTVSHLIRLVYNEEPAIECYDVKNVVDVKQGAEFDIYCNVSGTPQPKIAWLVNGFSVRNDSALKTNGGHISFRPIEKRHAGNLQIFARNSVRTVYKTISIRVTPLSTSDTEGMGKNPHRHNGRKNNRKLIGKHGKNKSEEMIPPTKPMVTRVNDESVMVRWSVPENDGLGILFFKVQYRELGPAKGGYAPAKGWKTTNADIPPTINNFEVTNLKPEHIYRFRVAAVYSNDDNNNSVNSDKFHLQRLDFEDRNPLPIPSIVHTDTINATAVRIHWNYTSAPNVSVEGYYISFLSSSKAGDYMTATVDGPDVTSYIIGNLQPDMFYDVKLQTFNSKSASDFSPIMKAKTAPLPVAVTPPNKAATATPTTTKTNTNNKLYIFIAVGVIVAALIISIVVTLFVCRKWKQKKNFDSNKSAVDEHHIQADGSEYVVNAKSLPRSNGCGLPTNRITITANPLADADNKKFLDRIFSRIKT